ncbi:MAG: GAF domain-containing protein [Fimbriimonas sp.]
MATGRELQLLELASLGYTDKRISADLQISRATVAGYWRRIMLRNGAASRTELVARYAMGKREIELSESHLQDEMATRSLAESTDREQNNLLQSIKEVANLFARGRTNFRQVFQRCLEELIGLTSSEYGFIAEVLTDPGGNPYLKTHALTDISWDVPTQELYDQNFVRGFEFRNLENLFGAVVTSQQVVIANDVVNDPRRGGIPRGHPSLSSFLGLPVMAGIDLVGVIGLANRPQGYGKQLVDFLSPLVATVSSVIVGLRAEADRLNAFSQLEEAISLLHPWDQRPMAAVVLLNADLNVRYLNDAFANQFLSGHPQSDFIGYPCQKLAEHLQSLFAGSFTLLNSETGVSAQGDRFVMLDGRVAERQVLTSNREGTVITLRVHHPEQE